MPEISEDIVFCDNLGDASVAIFGAPFDGTVSYRPGARFGPDAIISELYGIESFSLRQLKDLSHYRIFNCGSLALPLGNTPKVLELIYGKAAEILRAGKKPLMLGGEHLVSLGAVRAAAEKYPGLNIIHFDAHADLRDDYMGEKLSHAAVMRRIWEITGDGRIYQFGIRSCTRDEYEFSRAHTITRFFDAQGIGEVADRLKGSKVYVTIDLDVLDPSIMSGTGTPEAGGLSYAGFEEALGAISSLDIVGADIVELAPNYDTSGVSTSVACKILRELLLYMV